MSKHKILHFPKLNRWFIVIGKYRVDITATLDAILQPASERIDRLTAALKDVEAHIEELRQAWERGCINETDGLGGTRSNRNMAVLINLRRALEGK